MSAEVIEMTPHTLQRAGVVTEGNQYVQSTAVAPVASMFSGLTRQERELAVTGLIQTATGMLRDAVKAGEPAEVMAGYKDQAAAIADLTKRIDVSKDAVLDAQVLQRRAERGLGLAIRAGQASGAIRGAGGSGSNQHGGINREPRNSSGPVEAISPLSLATNAELSGDRGGDGIYAMADNGTLDDFNEALSAARAERNVSRANVVRKLKGAIESNQTGDGPGTDERLGFLKHLASKYPTMRIAFAKEGHQRYSSERSLDSSAFRLGVKWRFAEREYVKHAAQSADWLERSSMNLEVALDVLTHIDFSTITPEQAHEALQRIEALPHQLKLYIRELKGITNE